MGGEASWLIFCEGAFRQACSRFIDVDALIEVDKRNPAGAKSGVKKATKPESASGTSESSGKVDDELRNLLIDAHQATKRDDHGHSFVKRLR